MQGKLARGDVWGPLADAARHVERAVAAARDRALLGVVLPGRLELLRIRLRMPRDSCSPVGVIRVRREQHATLADDLDGSHLGERRVVAEGELRACPALERDKGIHVGQHIDRERLPGVRADLHGAGLLGRRAGRVHFRDRAERAHEGRHVVRAHVEQRAAASREKERGVWVEEVWTRVAHHRARRDRCADHPGREVPQGGLDARVQHRVRRDPHAQSRRVGRREERLGFLSVDADGLLDPHMLTRRDSVERHRHVGRRDREVDDDLDVVVREHRGGRTRERDPVGLGLLGSERLVEVAQRHNSDVGEPRQVVEVGVADHARSDDADADWARLRTRDRVGVRGLRAAHARFSR